ncbi:MAG: LysR family transcriptional regulator [Chloroflexi bacterium]|nr:LysR family transcriptional regulator [Chloroflexota bacterium]
MLTVVELQVFDAVARWRHFTRAAEELGVAQPSVTYHVRELERRLGVPLVDLVGRRVQLTDAGERLARRAAAILAGLRNLGVYPRRWARS